jgi:hypothetical protein
MEIPFIIKYLEDHEDNWTQEIQEIEDNLEALDQLPHVPQDFIQGVKTVFKQDPPLPPDNLFIQLANLVNQFNDELTQSINIASDLNEDHAEITIDPPPAKNFYDDERVQRCLREIKNLASQLTQDQREQIEQDITNKHNSASGPDAFYDSLRKTIYHEVLVKVQAIDSTSKLPLKSQGEPTKNKGDQKQQKGGGGKQGTGSEKAGFFENIFIFIFGWISVFKQINLGRIWKRNGVVGKFLIGAILIMVCIIVIGGTAFAVSVFANGSENEIVESDTYKNLEFNPSSESRAPLRDTPVPAVAAVEPTRIPEPTQIPNAPPKAPQAELHAVDAGSTPWLNTQQWIQWFMMIALPILAFIDEVQKKTSRWKRSQSCRVCCAFAWRSLLHHR